MIYTVTFNPALDYVVRVEDLTLGMVNRTKEEAIYYGGKGINVSTVLKNLGIESVALGFVAGFTGDVIEKGVKELGVATDFIHLQEGMSRINVKIRSNEESEINGQGPKIGELELAKLFEQLNQPPLQHAHGVAGRRRIIIQHLLRPVAFLHRLEAGQHLLVLLIRNVLEERALLQFLAGQHGKRSFLLHISLFISYQPASKK